MITGQLVQYQYLAAILQIKQLKRKLVAVKNTGDSIMHERVLTIVPTHLSTDLSFCKAKKRERKKFAFGSPAENKRFTESVIGFHWKDKFEKKMIINILKVLDIPADCRKIATVDSHNFIGSARIANINKNWFWIKTFLIAIYFDVVS